jgi:hypothetical protein
MDATLVPISLSVLGCKYVASLLALQQRTPIGSALCPSRGIDPDILGSEELWRYLALTDWVRVKQTCRAFWHLLESESVFKGLCSTLSGPSFVTGTPTWRQRYFLQHYVLSWLRARRQPREVQLDWNSGWVAHKFPPFGYTFELHQHVFWPSSVPVTLLSILNLRPSRRVHADCMHMTEASTRRRGRLLYFSTDLPIFWDQRRYVCEDGGRFFNMALRCNYHVSQGAVVMLARVIKQEVPNPKELVPLSEWHPWLPCSVVDQDSVRERIVVIGQSGRGVGLSD